MFDSGFAAPTDQESAADTDTDLVEKVCVGCGVMFTHRRVYTQGRRKYCTDECCDRAYQVRLKAKIAQIGWKTFRAAQTAGKRASKVREFYKSGPCADCQNFYDPVCMDFDHRPGEIKRFEVSEAISRNFHITVLAAEIAKCDLVCSNCHRIRTYGLTSTRERSGNGQSIS